MEPVAYIPAVMQQEVKDSIFLDSDSNEHQRALLWHYFLNLAAFASVWTYLLTFYLSFTQLAEQQEMVPGCNLQ